MTFTEKQINAAALAMGREHAKAAKEGYANGWHNLARIGLTATVPPGERMRRVIVESPYAGDIEANVTYARAALADCLKRGEAPIASHLLYTQPGVLDDSVVAERALGIEAGLIWGEQAEATVVYADRGMSNGMLQGIERAKAVGRPVEIRTLSEVAEEEDAPPWDNCVCDTCKAKADAWKPGDPCGSCGSTDTFWRYDGILQYGHCGGCGADDEDD